MSDSKNWGRRGPGILQMNALTVPIGEKINYFTPADTTTVLELLPGAGMVAVEVEAGTFRCRVGKLAPRAFTAEADDDRLTAAGHPYVDGDGPLRVEQTKKMTGDPGLTFDLVGAANDTLIRDAGSWIDDGFENGDVITVSGSASNDGDLTIVVITAAQLDFAGDVLVDEGPVTGVRIVVGALPGGLLFDTDYWVIDRDGDLFRLALTPDGPRVALSSDGVLGHLVGGDNGPTQNVGFAPLAPVAGAADVAAIGGKKLRTDELQAFDAPVTIVGEAGSGDILAWWTK